MREENDKSMERLNQTRDEPGKGLDCGAVAVIDGTEVKVACQERASSSANCQFDLCYPRRGWNYAYLTTSLWHSVPVKRSKCQNLKPSMQ
jgi:hypothetical protein